MFSVSICVNRQSNKLRDIPLINFFNFTLFRGNIPTDCKVANVVPIFKSGKNNLADNYHLISLTSIVVKTLECLIHKHIMKYLTDFQLLNDNQHGFRPSRSCVTQLLQLIHEWFQALDKLGSVDVVFLDFAMAFDKVSHAYLLYKLECYGIKGQILNWLRGFLTSRKQSVVIESQVSDWLSVTSGVPQKQYTWAFAVPCIHQRSSLLSNLQLRFVYCPSSTHRK